GEGNGKGEQGRCMEVATRHLAIQWQKTPDSLPRECPLRSGPPKEWVRRRGTGRGCPSGSVSPGLRLRLRPPPLPTPEGHPRPALQSPRPRTGKQASAAT